MLRGFVMIYTCSSVWNAPLLQISKKKTVEELVMHGDDLEPYLRTSDGGIAHVVNLKAVDAATFFRDSPYSWGDPKGSSKTTVCVAGRWRRYEVNTRTCSPPMVCARMSADVASAHHTKVDFDDPIWFNAMRICELDGDAESQVYKTTLVSLYRARTRGVHTCLDSAGYQHTRCPAVRGTDC